MADAQKPAALVVEDEKDGHVASECLKEKGYEALWVASKEAAFREMDRLDREGHPLAFLASDQNITDGPTGIEVMGEARRRYPGIPIALIGFVTDGMLKNQKIDPDSVQKAFKPVRKETFPGHIDAAIALAAKITEESSPTRLRRGEINMSEQPPKKPIALVVEDDYLIKGILRGQLGNTYEVIMVDRADKAIEEIGKFTEAPAILVTDWGLKQGDGFEVIAAARAKFPALPVLMISGHSDAPAKLREQPYANSVSLIHKTGLLQGLDGPIEEAQRLVMKPANPPVDYTKRIDTTNLSGGGKVV